MRPPVLAGVIGRQAREVSASVRLHAVIDLNRFVPVIEFWLCRARSIAGPFRRILGKFTINLRMGFTVEHPVIRRPGGNPEGLAGHVIKIVVSCVFHRGVVVGAEIPHAGWSAAGAVSTRHMVRHDVDHHLQAVLVRARHQRFEFIQTLGRIAGQIGIDIVIILDRIRRARAAFDHVRIVPADAIRAVVGNQRMMRYAGVPDVGHAELLDPFQRLVVEVFEFTDTILFTGAPGNVGGLPVAEQTGEHLIDDDLAVLR